MRRCKFWVLAIIVLIVSSGGAASGTILTGYIGGDVAMDVSPSLELEDPWLECLSDNQTVFVSLDYDKLSFRVIAEVDPGDCFLIHLPVINEATVDTRVLLSIFYPYGASLWVSGSGAIDDVVAMSYQAWKFTADAGVQGTGSVPYDGVRIQVCVSPNYTGDSVEINGSIGSTTGMNGPFVIFSGQLSEDVLYLHNSPSPPTGDRESQPNLPMNMYLPSAATLYNFDNDLDLDPGRIIVPTTNTTVGDISTYQNWQITLTEDVYLDGNVAAILWTGTQYFNRSIPGTLIAYLRDLSDAGYEEIGYGILTLDPWQPDEADWVERKIIINNVDYTVPAGHTLDLTVVTGTDSSAMWLAYDTIRYPSRLVLNSFPEAEFSADFVSTVNGTITVNFNDLSTSDEGIASWAWDFGDSANSSDQNPQHTYYYEDTFTVTLTVTEDDGDSDTEVKFAQVTESGVTLTDTGPTAEFTGTPLMGAAPLTVVFTESSTSDDGILFWSWDFGDGQISGMQNPIVVYDTPGIYTVSLTVTEKDGDTDIRTRTDYVTALGNMPPIAEFSAAPTFGYSPLSVDFTDESSSWDGIVNWLWDFGDNTTSPDPNPTHVYNTEGTYEVSLTVTEADSDNDTMVKTDYVTVLPAGVPFAEFTATPTSGSEPFTVNFTDQSMSSEGIISWLWLFGDTSNSTDQHPLHTYMGDGVYTVSLTITEADTDFDTMTKVDYITVSDVGPTANFTASPASGYSPLSVDFTDLSTSNDGIATWLWDFGDNNTSPLPNPTHEYATDGLFTVSLTVTEADTDFDTMVKTDHIMVLPVTTYAVVYQGWDDDGYLRTLEIDTDGLITDSAIDTLEFDTSDGENANIIHISGNIYAIAYERYDTGYLRTVEMIMDGEINDSVIDTLTFDFARGLVPDIIHVYDDIYAIAYRGPDDDGFLRTVEIATDGQITNSVIDTFEFNGFDGREPDIIHVSGNIYAITYQGSGDNGYISTVEIATDGQITNWTIDNLVFDYVRCRVPNITNVSGNIYAVAYQGPDDDGFLSTVEIATNGQITDSVIDTFEFNGFDGRAPDTVHVSGNIYAITYQGSGDNGYISTVEIATDGQITNWTIDNLVFDYVRCRVPNITNVSGNIYAVAYQGPDDDGFLRTVEIATDGQITNSIIDTYQFDGFQGRLPDVIRFSATPNIAPVAVNDIDTCLENWFVVVTVLANDSDADGYTLGITNLTDPSWGTAFLNPDGTVTYTPYEGYVGTDSFTYTVTDGMVDSNVATVEITVTP